MRPGAWDRMKEVFQAAVERPEDERAAFVAEACGGDGELQARLEAMLAAHAREDTLLALDPDAPGPTLAGREARATMEGGRIGGYRIVRVIAAGGMGVVYEAEQAEPERRVALKVLHAHCAAPDSVRRFRREAAILGRLRHPRIAQVHEAGVHEGPDGATLPWFSMELVDGRPLDVFAREERLGLRERLELFARLCEALETAHERGVVHRDLKPGNVLVEPSGEPKVLDFGVARMTGSHAQRTLETGAGQLVGTVPYMSPEQAGGGNRELDARSDVYSLGVVLFQLLTGRLPYSVTGLSILDALRVIQEDEPDPLGAIYPRVPGEVETIVNKALEKEPMRRYASAGELGADVRRHLADEPIVARPATTLYQLRKFARRNKALVGGLAAVLVTLVVGLVATGLALAEAEREAQHARAISQLLTDLIVGGDPVDHFYEREAPPPREGSLTVVDLLDRAVEGLDQGLAKRPEVEAELRERIGRAYFGHSRLASSAALLSQALALYRELGDVEAELRTMEHLSRALNWEDRFDESMPLGAEMVALAERELGPNDRRTLRLRCSWSLNRAMVVSDDEALAFARDTLARCEAVLAEDDPIRIHALMRVALVRGRMGERGEARERMAEVLELCERHLPPTHFLRISAMFFTGNFTPNELADRKEALWREAREGYAYIFGEDHFLTVVADGAVLEGTCLWRPTWTREEHEAVWARAAEAYELLIPRADELLGPCNSSTELIVRQYGQLLARMDGYGHEALDLLEDRLDCLPHKRFVWMVQYVTASLLTGGRDPVVLERAEELVERTLDAAGERPDLEEALASLGGTRAVLLEHLERR